MLKMCACCKEYKRVSEFYVVRGCYYSYCKECQREKARKNYARPETKERVKAYYTRPDIVEKVHAYKRATPRHMLSIGLNRALKRRPTNDPITIEGLFQIWKDQNGKCAVSGIVMTWMAGKHTATSISIDRIDSSLGYTRDNVRLICNAVNRFKGDGVDDEMIAMARAIVDKADGVDWEETWRSSLNTYKPIYGNG